MAGIIGGMKLTHNRFAYKNDYDELVDIANFIRARFKTIKVKIEANLLFKDNGKPDRFEFGLQEGNTQKWRNPDLSLFVNKKFLCCIEIDGAIHDINVEKTDKRNADYKKAKVDLIIVNKEELKIDKLNKFEYIERELR